MIVADSSVVVAILREEGDAPGWVEAFNRSRKTLMSVVSFVETSMVIYGRARDTNPSQVTDLFEALRIDITTVDREQGLAAVTAFLRYGKGRHPAGLNLADCFS